MPYLKDDYCSYCGYLHVNQDSFPRKCPVCGNETYRNPIPVVVGLVRCYGQIADSWIVGKRNIPPHIGGWALTGGYIDYNETWQQAIVREYKEEIGLSLDHNKFDLVEIINNDNGKMIIFAHYNSSVDRSAIKFIPNSEVSEIAFPENPQDLNLCFPSHNHIWNKVYNSYR